MILTYVIFVSLALCTHGKQLHEHMTKEEIESVFNCKHDLVHEVEYEVTPVLHVAKVDNKGRRFRRSNSIMHLKAFDKNITLYLEPNDSTLLGSNTPLFLAKRNRRARSLDGEPQIIYSRMQFPMTENLKMYHDMENRAAVTVYPGEANRAHVHGIIGDELIIKPIPARVRREILPKYPEFYQSSLSYRRPNGYSRDPFFSDPFSGESLFGNFYEPTHHIVIKPKVQINSAYYDPNEGRWKQLKPQWHSKDSDEDLINDYNDFINPFFNWKNSLKQSSPWRTTTRAPFTWRPATRKPFTWSPSNREPPAYRTTTRQPYTFRPFTREPSSTPKSVTSRPVTSAPITQRPYDTEKPIAPKIKPIAEESDIVYPELLVSVDYETYVAHGSDLKELANYMAAFWNAVDLRFRELSDPKVRLNIAGLIVPETREATPYLEKGRVGNEAIVAEDTLSAIGKYFAQEEQFPKDMYDIPVAISHRDLGSFDPNGQFNDGTTGIATLGRACHVEDGSSGVLIRDKGGFNGITTAAHELAHSMGALHDGDDTSRIPGGPCSWSDGYLMSYQRKDSRGMHWSSCSKTAMRMFLQKDGQCMRNKPNVGTAYPKVLPGRLLSRDEQCERSLGSGWKSDEEKEGDCAVLHCKQRVSGNTFNLMNEHRPPAEGSYCGKGAICLDAECVKDPMAA